MGKFSEKGGGWRLGFFFLKNLSKLQKVTQKGGGPPKLSLNMPLM